MIRPLHTRLTHLWASSTPFPGILVSRRWSFPSWDHPAQPEACIYLLHPHHPLKTKAWVATPSEMTMNPSLETRQLQVDSGMGGKRESGPLEARMALEPLTQARAQPWGDGGAEKEPS